MYVSTAATINTKEKNVSTPSEIFEDVSTVATVFANKDVDWINSGMLVPFSTLADLIEHNPDRILSLAREIAVTIKQENSKNEVLKEIIKQRLGDQYTVTHKPVTKRQGQSFSPYSRSRHDLCIQHKENHFRCGTLKAAVVGGSMTIETEESEEIDGDVVEFKSSTFSRDQILAEMVCTLTDSSIDLLKKGKQINRATIYGLSVNYATVKSIVYKMSMDFSSNSLSLVKLTNELPLSESLNFLTSAISKY